MNAISIKKTEDKLEKKKAKLQKLLTTKNQIEYKIKLLKTDIENLQTRQFEQFKKAAIVLALIACSPSVRTIFNAVFIISSFVTLTLGAIPYLRYIFVVIYPLL